MQEKRFPPTPKRLRDARKRGDVAHSADVSQSVMFVVLLVLLWALSGSALAMLRSLWLHATDPLAFARVESQWSGLLQHATIVLLSVCVTVCAVAALMAAAGSFVQVGGLAAWSRLAPNAARMNPGQAVERLFSMRSVIDLAKMIVKTLLLGLLLLVVLRGQLASAARLGYLGPAAQMAAVGHAILVLMAWAAVIHAAMAGVDWLHQKYEFTKRNRMSFEELQREHQETEGSPLMQSRRRAEHHETVFASVADRIGMATLVVHSRAVAVALQYQSAEALPRVVARGQAEAAEQIRRLAAEQTLYVELNPELAEQLWREAPLDQVAPPALSRPLASLLRRAQRLE